MVLRATIGRDLRGLDRAARAPGLAAAEYDGRQHAESPEQYDRDITRREDIEDWEWRIVVITACDVVHLYDNRSLSAPIPADLVHLHDDSGRVRGPAGRTGTPARGPGRR